LTFNPAIAYYKNKRTIPAPVFANKYLASFLKKVRAIKTAIEDAILNGEIENSYDDAKAFILPHASINFHQPF
jgi:hypothetical protein